MIFHKQIALLMAGALAVGTLAGCGGSKENTDAASSDSKGNKTLTVLTHRTDMDAVFKTYKEEFEKSHPGVTVNFEAVNDYQNTLSTRMGTEDYGDVLMMPANITKNQYKDFYEPMGTYDELKDKYGYLDNVNVDGTVYGLATGVNAIGFVYNDAVFKQAGIEKNPTSPEEYIADLKLIKEKTDAIPYYTNYVADWCLTNYSNTIEIEMAGDTDYMNKLVYDKNTFLPGTAIYDSLKLLHDAVKEGLVEDDPMTSDWEYSKQAMADGKIGVMCLGSWAVGQIKALSKNPDDIKFMPAPAIHDGKQMIQISPDYNMGVNIHSKNKELAKEFVKYFVEKYPEESNMISSIVGAKLPDYLSTDENTELVQAVPGTTESAQDFDTVQKESLINLADGTWIKTIIEIGLGNSNQTFDEYMQSLNKAWVSGIEATGK